MKNNTTARTTGTGRKDRTKTRRREPGMALHIRDTMGFLQRDNIDRNRKGTQPLQETFTFKGFAKAIDIKREHGQSHNEISEELEQAKCVETGNHAATGEYPYEHQGRLTGNGNGRLQGSEKQHDEA